jgi:hypothetical protein
MGFLDTEATCSMEENMGTNEQSEIGCIDAHISKNFETDDQKSIVDV